MSTHYAQCEDGRVRAFRYSGEADTFFSCPARVSVRGRTVSGFVTGDRWAQADSDPRIVDGDHILTFFAYAYRKNHALVGG